MNFFEYQDQARKNTRWLVFLFILAVITLIGLTDLLVVVCYFSISSKYSTVVTPIPVSTHITIAIAIGAVVIFASLYRMAEMNGGGRRVAEELGGRLIPSSTRNRKERRLLNVVEEMAIASGMPVPQVYVLEDSAINAFAAGYNPHDAVIGVTRGMVDLLSRDELQGVIAHEFSHIFNGDMRLNIRLIGILFGILFIALIGQKIVRYSGRSREGAKAGLFGIGLIVIGYGGLFFGNLIKAVVSRQREFLADASSVQFTRNPEAIGGALKKIGGWSFGSKLTVTNAEEYSHFYIANGVSSFASGFFSTHPSLKDRIYRIEPGWDGKFSKVKREKTADAKVENKNNGNNKIFSADSFKQADSLITTAAIITAIASTGMPTSDHVQYARKLIADIPESLLLASRDPMSAYALVLGLITSKELLKNPVQLDSATKVIEPEIKTILRKIFQPLISLDIKYRLPLIELAIPSLKSLSEAQQKKFKQDLLLIIKLDDRVESWEWALHRIITLSLKKAKIPRARYSDFSSLQHECRILLSAVIYSSNCNIEMRKAAFNVAAKDLDIDSELIGKENINVSELMSAIQKICELKPLVKPRFLKALAYAVQHDGVVEAEEVEFIRAIAEGIDCPMPPLLDAHFKKDNKKPG